MAVTLFAVFVNTFAANYLPMIENVVLGFHVVGFFAILIPLWVLAPKASTNDVFTEFSNYGGWSSVGASCLVGQLAASGAFIGM